MLCIVHSLATPSSVQDCLKQGFRFTFNIIVSLFLINYWLSQGFCILSTHTHTHTSLHACKTHSTDTMLTRSVVAQSLHSEVVLDSETDITVKRTQLTWSECKMTDCKLTDHMYMTPAWREWDIETTILLASRPGREEALLRGLVSRLACNR